MSSPSVPSSSVHGVLSAELDRRRAELLAIDPRLGEFMDHLVRFVRDGGKRLRSEFLLGGWQAAASAGGSGRDVPRPVVRVAAAIELLHACALIHDDVIDRSDTRRGRPSTHRAVAKAHADAGLAGDPEHYGISAAILLGDLALAWADDLFAAAATELDAMDRALPVWRAIRIEVLAGQLLDLAVTASAVSDPATQVGDAMVVNRFKTAAYTVERPLHLGAALAGGRPGTIAALRRYGADIGIAFQLRDDLLGVFGDPAVTGKPAGDDLVEGKRTLLLASARSSLRDRPDLLARLDAGIGVRGADVDRLVEIIEASGAREQMEHRIDELVASGLCALDPADATGGPVVAAAARGRLHELAAAATARIR